MHSIDQRPRRAQIVLAAGGAIVLNPHQCPSADVINLLGFASGSPVGPHDVHGHLSAMPAEVPEARIVGLRQHVQGRRDGVDARVLPNAPNSDPGDAQRLPPRKEVVSCQSSSLKIGR